MTNFSLYYKNNIQFILIISLFIVILLLPQTSFPKELINSCEINISSDSNIKVKINSMSLINTIKCISQKSNIYIEIPDSLQSDIINASFTDSSWHSVIKRILKKYNIAFGWENGEIKSVFIFERGGGKVLDLIPISDIEDQNNKNSQSNIQNLDNLQKINPIYDKNKLHNESVKTNMSKSDQAISEDNQFDKGRKNKSEFYKLLPHELPPDRPALKDNNISETLSEKN